MLNDALNRLPFNVALDYFLCCTIFAGALGTILLILLAHFRFRKFTFQQVMICGSLGGILGGGAVGIVTACLIDSWPEALISVPLAFLIGGAIGIVPGLVTAIATHFLKKLVKLA